MVLVAPLLLGAGEAAAQPSFELFGGAAGVALPIDRTVWPKTTPTTTYHVRVAPVIGGSLTWSKVMARVEVALPPAVDEPTWFTNQHLGSAGMHVETRDFLRIITVLAGPSLRHDAVGVSVGLGFSLIERELSTRVYYSPVYQPAPPQDEAWRRYRASPRQVASTDSTLAASFGFDLVTGRGHLVVDAPLLRFHVGPNVSESGWSAAVGGAVGWRF